jgi:hypothetical protein
MSWSGAIIQVEYPLSEMRQTGSLTDFGFGGDLGHLHLHSEVSWG